MSDETRFEFPVGVFVEKVGGDYSFGGYIVAAFKKRSSVVRYVVENGEGLLHIFSGRQLRCGKPRE